MLFVTCLNLTGPDQTRPDQISNFEYEESGSAAALLSAVGPIFLGRHGSHVIFVIYICTLNLK